MPLLTKAEFRRRVDKRSNSITKAYSDNQLLNESRSPSRTRYDIFLSHSFDDKDEIAVLKEILEENGHSVYVDWVVDSHLNRRRVTKSNVNLIRQRMAMCKSLVYAFSDNSTHSKWMQWELGVFDGSKKPISIFPIVDNSSDTYNGTDFLQVYPYITIDSVTTGGRAMHVNEASNVYTTYGSWLSGGRPFQR